MAHHLYFSVADSPGWRLLLSLQRGKAAKAAGRSNEKSAKGKVKCTKRTWAQEGWEGQRVTTPELEAWRRPTEESQNWVMMNDFPCSTRGGQECTRLPPANCFQHRHLASSTTGTESLKCYFKIILLLESQGIELTKTQARQRAQSPPAYPDKLSPGGESRWCRRKLLLYSAKFHQTPKQIWSL